MTVEVTTQERINLQEDSFLFPSEINASDIYLREIKRYPRLPVDKEKYLSQIMYEGLSFKNGKREFGEHKFTNQDAEDAFIGLFNSHQRLVVGRVNKFRESGFFFMDHISAGRFGLMRGLVKYIPSYETRVSSYVTWWIDREIRDWRKQKLSIIHIPADKADQLYQLNRIKTSLTQELGEEPNVKMLSERSAISEEEILELFNSRNVVSLQVKYKNDSNYEELGERIKAPGRSTESQAIFKIRAEKIREVITSAIKDERDRNIILLKFGFYDGKDRTFQEISNIFRVSRQRIEQLFRNAMKILNEPEVKEKLRILI